MNYSLIASCLVISTCLASSELKKVKVDATGLLSAILDDRYDDVVAELNRGVSVNASNEVGSALYLAVRDTQSVRIAQLLLERGADVDSGSTENNYSPLIVAVELDHLELFNLLLEYQANPNATTSHGYTALHVAAQHGRIHMARTLLEKGASLNVETIAGTTPLLMAAEHYQQEIVQLFLAQQEKPHIGNRLHSYSKEDLTVLINRLIDYTHPKIAQLMGEKENGN